jgi:endonuclease YncB( thermonuclease family)
VLGRRQRTALTVISLIGAVLLVWLDRQVLSPGRTSWVADANRPPTADVGIYHTHSATVIRVVDGDTLHVDIPDRNDSKTKIRLLGIDAPELAMTGKPAMYFGREAAAVATQLALGKQVRLYIDERAGSRDKYGRLLAYIELPDDRFLNEVLLSKGYAYADRRFRHSYSQKYLQLEAAARSLHEGLWARVAPDQLPLWLQNRDPNLLRAR